MAKELDEAKEQVAVNIDAARTPILYTDNVIVSSNDDGVMLDFAQHVGPTRQHQVVTRVGMSVSHARKMLRTISEHLEKYER